DEPEKADLEDLRNTTLNSTPDCGREALKYIAGYIAFRCQNEDKSLGTPTGQLKISQQNQFEWIQTLSRGGLRVPSKSWLEIIEQFEIIFLLLMDAAYQRMKV
uniref:Uncharacterized protein n=1 Tax=Strigamia maritima TaxID=126957 RepID=T1J3C7_STRMM